MLGIEKPNGDYLAAPRGHVRLVPDDCLILYGQQSDLVDLGERRAGMEGNVQHMLAVTRQLDIREQEIETDITSESN